MRGLLVGVVRVAVTVAAESGLSAADCCREVHCPRMAKRRRSGSEF